MQGFVLNTRNLCGYILPPAVREKIVILEYSIVYALSRTCRTLSPRTPDTGTVRGTYILS